MCSDRKGGAGGIIAGLHPRTPKRADGARGPVHGNQKPLFLATLAYQRPLSLIVRFWSFL